MVPDIIALLRLFQAHVPDHETNSVVLSLAADHTKWALAHDTFTQIRRRNLAVINEENFAKECQYYFEEVCLQSIYNESGGAAAPFDSDSPYWIIKNAIQLARAIGLSEEDVIAIVAPVG